MKALDSYRQSYCVCSVSRVPADSHLMCRGHLSGLGCGGVMLGQGAGCMCCNVMCSVPQCRCVRTCPPVVCAVEVVVCPGRRRPCQVYIGGRGVGDPECGPKVGWLVGKMAQRALMASAWPAMCHVQVLACGPCVWCAMNRCWHVGHMCGVPCTGALACGPCVWCAMYRCWHGLDCAHTAILHM